MARPRKNAKSEQIRVSDNLTKPLKTVQSEFKRIWNKDVSLNDLTREVKIEIIITPPKKKKRKKSTTIK